MAELVIKIGDGSNYLDRDILCAFNDDRIRRVHAQHICFRRQGTGRRFELNGMGLVPGTSLARDFMQNTCEFKNERLSKTRLQITRLSDSQTVELESNVMFANPFRGDRMQQMDVGLYVERRLRTMQEPNAKGFPIFGTPGREIWYSGRSDNSATKISLVWDAIETKTSKSRTDSEFGHWPNGTQDLKSHLFLSVNDFDTTEADNLVTSEVNETDPDDIVVIHVRKHYVIWQDIFPLDVPPVTTRANVEDKGRVVDIRSKQQNRAAIVRVKQ